ncbi:Adenylyltransferase and sulfurtransferase MOCS3 [Plecturocebus cupreus]
MTHACWWVHFEGQITAYRYDGGPCYRCDFPQPPTPRGDSDQLRGPWGAWCRGPWKCWKLLRVWAPVRGSPFLFDAPRGHFCCIWLRSHRLDSAVCGERPTVTDLLDYEAFCGSLATDKCHSLQLLSPEERVSVTDYKRLLDSGAPHLWGHALHIPLKHLEHRDGESLKLLGEAIWDGKQSTQERAALPIYVICKLGNESQKAVMILQYLAAAQELDSLTVRDAVGGLMAWSAKIDGTFPQD